MYDEFHLRQAKLRLERIPNNKDGVERLLSWGSEIVELRIVYKEFLYRSAGGKVPGNITIFPIWAKPIGEKMGCVQYREDGFNVKLRQGYM